MSNFAHIIFDIDGTLAKSHDVDFELFFSSLEKGLGLSKVSRSMQDYPDVTDSGIVHSVVKRYLGRDVTNTELEHLGNSFSFLLEEHIGAAIVYEELAGSVHLVKMLEKMGVPISIATGNWRKSAFLKLSSLGLGYLIEKTSSSTEEVRRSKIIERALEYGKSNTWYIGDGEWDLVAATDLGINFLGVGHKLKGQSQFWTEDFTDSQKVIDLLFHRVSK